MRVKELLNKINLNQFKIFTSPVIQKNWKVHNPNFTLNEKKQLRTIFRLLFNEYLINFFKWEPQGAVRETIAKIPHRIFLDRRLPLETYVGKYYIPLMKKSEGFKHLVEQTDLRKLPTISVSELLHLEVPINKHPIFHGESRTPETTEPHQPEVDKEPEVVKEPAIDKQPDSEVVEHTAAVTEELFNRRKPDPDLQFIAQLAGLKGQNAIRFTTQYKTQPLDTKNAITFFGKNIPLATLKKLNYAIALMNLTKGHRATTTTLFNIAKTSSVKELAKNTGINWQNLIKRGVRGPKFTGVMLEKRIAQAHPSAYVVARLQGQFGLVKTFLNKNPKADIFTTKIDYKDTKRFNWTGIAPKQKAILRKQIQTLLRTRKLVPDVRFLPHLVNSGFSSAHEVLAVSRKELAAKTNIKNARILRFIYRRSRKIANEAMAVLNLHLDNQRNTAFSFTPQRSGSGQGAEDLGYQSIFGSLDNCSCDHCNSVLSPAAYLVDLIHYLKSNNSSALDELRDRRPDLWKIDLNCEETFNLHPQLELIVDVLSTYVVEKGNEKFPNAPDNIDDILYLPSPSTEVPFEPDHLQTKLLAEHTEVSLFDIYSQLEVDLQYLIAQKIGLGPLTLFALTKEITFQRNKLPVKAPVKEFTTAYNLSFDELTTLVNTNVGEKLSLTSEVVKDQNGQPKGVEHFVKVETTTNQPLKESANYQKKIFSFLRIYRHLDYDMETLDRYLSLSKVDQKDYSAQHMSSFSLLLYLRDTYSLSDDALTLMRDAYSDADIADLGGKLDRENQVQLSQLLLFLGLAESDFVLLETALTDLLQYDQGQLLLSKENMTLLKRSVIWSGIAKMSISEWVLFLKMELPAKKGGISITAGVQDMLHNQNWIILLTLIHLYERLGIPVKLIQFYLRSKPNDEWYFYVSAEEVKQWLANLKSSQTQFSDLPEFTDAIAGLIDADSQVVQVLFEKWLTLFDQQNAEQRFLDFINDFIQEGEGESETEIKIDDNVLKRTLAVIKALDKNVQLLSYLELNGETLAYFLEHLDGLSVNIKNPAIFIMQLCDYARWMRGLENHLGIFAHLFPNTGYEMPEEDFKTDLGNILSVTPETLNDFTSVFNWEPQELANWNKFFNAIALCNVMKWSPKQLFEVSDVGQILKAPRKYYEMTAKYFEQSIQLSGHKEEKKVQIIEGVSKNLLERKRDVLVGLLKSPIFGFKSTSKIYEHFLLDVETSSCSEISKIKAAILSVQLFVHRCLMNLEKRANQLLSFDEEASEEWEWRKNYRVWEVNRKIFLYPENYLDPNLRDDKSPIYENLEGDMKQRDLSPEGIQKVYQRYLKEFSTVAKLSMAGSFKDKENNIHYYFGRTTNKPFRYYYKTYKKSSRAWSPWHPIDVNIESGYLAGIVAYGRMFIFWKSTKVITESEFENGDSNSSGINQNTKKTIKQIINYCYREEDGSWSSPTVIDADITAWAKIDVPGIVIKLNADAQLFDDFIRLTRFNQKLTVSFSNQLVFTDADFDRLEAQVVIDIVSHKFLRKQTGIDTPMPGSLAGYATLTEAGVELFKPNANFSEHYYINSVSKSDESSTLGPVITSNRKLSVINGQEIGNYVVDNAGMNYQYLAFNNGLYPLNSYVVTKLSNTIFSQGLDDFLKPDTQENTNEVSHLQIADNILAPNNLFMPESGLDFHGPNGVYFRELYFHIPFTLARHFNQQQQFKESDYWYKKIFNPTAPSENNQQYWQYLPFRRGTEQQMGNILQDSAALEKYHDDPFNPHAVARLRTSAYPKAIVMGYIDNLLDWGDHLFRQDTYESINQAMMLYITGQQLLGEKPQSIVKCKTLNETKTLAEIEESLTHGNEILIEVESLNAENQVPSVADLHSENILLNNTLARRVEDEADTGTDAALNDATLSQSFVEGVLFCIPWNETLLEYWDRIEDRMFKIRNCLNIDGEYRQLALFEPAIDPMLLVRAAAAGIEVGQLIDRGRKLPYRFTYLLEKVRSYLSVIQSFGQNLLSTLEKQDGEALNELRTLHEGNLLQLNSLSKQKRLEQLEYEKVNLEIGKERILANIEHFNDLITSQGFVKYKLVDKYLKKATGLVQTTQILNFLTSAIYLIPQIGAPTAMTFGGKNTGDSIKSGTKALQTLGAYFQMSADIMERAQDHNIRNKGWNLSLLEKKKELQTNENSISVNALQHEIALRDLESHEQQIEQNQEILDFYAEKMGNEALYSLMSGHLTRLFRNSYGLVQEMALEAQRAYKFETNDSSGSFIALDNWDTASMGLLSAEKLQHQLMLMETAYLERNTRKAEIRSNVSLALLDPIALLTLRSTGECTVNIPERWFDMQYPGQYKRRIKTVSLSIPCVTGPYVNVSCRLDLQSSNMRTGTDLTPLDPVTALSEANSRIFTSSGQNDAGLLEFNFRDERYLPFEGAGVDSQWKLKFPNHMRSFDYGTITDVIFHISYTAEYATDLETKVENDFALTNNKINENGGLFRVFSLKQEFSDSWHLAKANDQSMELNLKREHFPFFAHYGSLALKTAELKEMSDDGVIDFGGSIVLTDDHKNLEEPLVLENLEFEKELFLVVNYSI